MKIISLSSHTDWSDLVVVVVVMRDKLYHLCIALVVLVWDVQQ